MCDIDPDTIRFSDHALSRIQERFGAKNPEKSGRRNLRRAVEETILPAHRALRLMNNNYQDARYFAYGPWRFVIANGVVVTVERRKEGTK